MFYLKFPDVPFKVDAANGEMPGGWICAHNKLEDGHEINFFIARGIVDINPEVEIEINGDIRWFRLLRKVELPPSSLDRARLTISYAAESSNLGLGSEIGVVGVYGRDKTGYYGPISKLHEGILISDTKAISQGTLELRDIPEHYHEIYLVIEFRHPCEVKIFDLELAVPESEEEFFQAQLEDVQTKTVDLSVEDVAVPYRIAEFSSSDLLASLNDSIDHDLRKKPISWMNGMLTVALRNEDYDTAIALVRHAIELAKVRNEPISVLEPLVDAVCKVFISTGDHIELERFAILVARSGLEGRLRDRVIEKFRLAFGEVGSSLFSLNKDLVINSANFGLSHILSFLTGRLSDHLILANYYRARNAKRQNEEINAYFSEFDLPFEIELGEDDANVLIGLNQREKESIQHKHDSPDTEDAKYQPLVSVIVAAFNCEDTIDYALRSLLDQSYQKIEILIADDCSDDKTRKKLKEYQKLPNIRVFQSEKNQGPYNIRNALISEAKGELITFHDSDDFALSHRIETQVSTMIREGTVMSVGRWFRVTPNGHFVNFPDGEFLRMCVNSIMFHRKIFNIFGPYRSVLFGADSEFYEIARGYLRSDQVSQIEVPGVLGLWSSSSLTKRPGIEVDESGYRAPKRRLYASLAGRQRMLGKQIIPDDFIEDILKDADIYREAQPIKEFK